MAKRMVKIVKRGKTVIRKTVVRPKAAAAKKQAPKQIPKIKATNVAATNGILVLEDRQIAAMMADPRYTSVIPCLKASAASAKKVGKRCGRCNRKRSNAKNAIMRTTRQCIASMGKNEKEQLKKLTGASKIQVMTVAGKRTKPVTF